MRQKFPEKCFTSSSSVKKILGSDCSGSKINDEAGFSTAGMVLSLLITLSLIFTTAQVYQVNSAAATIQNVADVAVLAAENEVAEFYILVRVCDAIVLSLSLTGVALIGVGIVALCIPATATLGEKFIETGDDILKARNNFAEKAAEGLNALQKILPFVSAANASILISENSGGAMNASYGGTVILLPFEGEEITVGSFDASTGLSESVEENQDRIQELAEKAEEAAADAKIEKERAFQHDCGNSPSYCMYERAGKLSAISEAQNPLYHSIDAWDFSVALKRAQAYYPSRLATEAPTGASTESQADSALRIRFYTYASEELAKGYVREDSTGSFEAYFPLLPKNTNEMKETILYTEVVYPVTSDGSGNPVMHAWDGCPSIGQSMQNRGSILQLDGGGYATCSQCEFTVSSFGKIAAASSSIENGFEYHYRIVAESAAAYQDAMEKYTPYAEELQTLTEGLFDEITHAFDEAISYRIKAEPPGRIGAVALVVNTQSVSASTNFASSFVSDGGTLGAQVAISAATLVEDSSDGGSTIISSLLNGVSAQSHDIGLSMVEGALDLWSSILFVYTEGQEALREGIENTLDSIPLASESGLGTWASSSFYGLVESLGFEPVDLDAPKAVLVNSAHVLEADESSFSKGILDIKQSYLSLEGKGSGSIFSSAISQLETRALESVESFGSEIVIASIELFGESGPSIPITIALPPAITGIAKNFISDIAARLQGIESSVVGIRRWE